MTVFDSAGQRVVAGLTDGDGRFRLQATTPRGPFTLKAQRIGYGTAESQPLGATGTLNLELTLRGAPIAIEAVEATGVRRCRIDGDEGLRLHELWEEARKALEVAAWTQAEGRLRLQGRGYEQIWTGRVDEERSWILDSGSRPPFFSEPARSLIDEGYIRPVSRGEAFDYFGPDASVVLSAYFREAYCFRLREPQGRGTGLTGLAFQPVERRGVPDITGVLWLDSETARLHSLEFEYTFHLLEPPIPRELYAQFGGLVEFRELPNGAWVTDRWRLRMPQYQTLARVLRDRIPDWWIGGFYDVEQLPPGAREILTHLGMTEVGGELATLETDEGIQVLTAALAVIDGLAFDSTRGAPLAGARLELAGTSYRSTTDAQGRFRIAEPTEGLYALELRHPRLDTLGIESLTQEVELVRGSVRQVQVAVPSRGSLLPAECPSPGVGEGVVVGVVRDRASGGPPPGATVRLWATPVDEKGTDDEPSLMAESLMLERWCVMDPRRLPLSCLLHQ